MKKNREMLGKIGFVGWMPLLGALAVPFVAAQEGAQPSAVSQPPTRATSVEEVVVTARRREERLQDLPGSAAALTEGFLNDIGGISQLRDMMDLVVGVTAVETQWGDHLTEPNIRGAGQSRNRTSASATGIYRDGAYFASTSIGGRNFERMDTYDVQRVELLRGAQGALYGRNALGGAINMISRRPDDQFNIEAGVLAGENKRRGYETILNLPIADVLATRFSYVNDRQRGGFYEDLAGDPLDTKKYQHVRGSVAYDPTEALNLRFMVDYMDEENPPGARTRREGSVAQFTGGDPFKTTINDPHYVRSKVYNFNLLADYALDNATLSSITNLRTRDVAMSNDNDFFGPSVPAATRRLVGFTTVDADIFFQEFRYISDLTGPLNFLVAADLYLYDVNEYIDNFARAQQTVPTSTIRDVNVEQRSWAVYGSVDYAFKDLPMVASFEARYAVDRVDGDVLGVLPNQNNAIQTDVSSDRTFRNLPWGVNLSWHFDQPLLPGMGRSMVYGKVATSYRHGGINLNEGLSTDRFQTKPLYGEEDALTYELGFKSSWLENSLTFNGAAFFVEYSDFLNTTTNGCPLQCTYFDPDTLDPLGFDPNGNPLTVTGDGREALASPQAFFIDNVGEVEAWGLELELNWRQIVQATGGRLNFNVGWSRQMGEIKSLGSDVSEAIADTKGARLNRLRPKQIKGNIIYRQPLPFLNGIGLRDTELLLSATYVHEHGGFETLSATPQRMATVDRMNARIGLDSAKWSFIIHGTNVLDKQYELWGNALFQRVNDPRYVYGELLWRLH